MKRDICCRTIECCDDAQEASFAALPSPPPPLDFNVFGHDDDPLLRNEFGLESSPEKLVGSSSFFSSDVEYIVHTPSPPPPPPPTAAVICYCSSCCSTSRRNVSPRNRTSLTNRQQSELVPVSTNDKWCNSLFVTTGCCRCQDPNNNRRIYSNSCCGQSRVPAPVVANLHGRSQEISDCVRYYLNEDKVTYENQVTEQGEDQVVWQLYQVKLNRVPGYGFGIAVSGGTDNPHFASGDPSIAVADVLMAGPADGKLMVNDRITTVNGISLENVEYGRAVQVLRDSGDSITLSVRRRLSIPSQESRILGVQLNKRIKKDDFGIVLGNHIYIKEITNSKLHTGNECALQEGDVILKINNQLTNNMSLKEAKKLIDSSKEKLSLTVQRGVSCSSPCFVYSNSASSHKEGNSMDTLNGNLYGVRQNLYVQPPTRRGNSLELEKSNLMPRTEPAIISSIKESQTRMYNLSPMTPPLSSKLNYSLKREGNVQLNNRTLSHNKMEGAAIQNTCSRNYQEPSRPPLHRLEDYYGISKMYEDELNNVRRSNYSMDNTRFVQFKKEGTVGIQLIGGNEVGIFVAAVQPDSPASVQGLQPGDKILKVNDFDMEGVTREEAFLFLSHIRDRICLIVQNYTKEYETIVASHRGDTFHIKVHFNYDQPQNSEMSFRKGDVFHVTDTMYNNVIGSWQVYRIGRNNQQVQKGVIPNKIRAEELATIEFNVTKKGLAVSDNRFGFLKMRKRNNQRRSKSLSKDHWEDVVFGSGISKFPAYERVILKHPGFIRPVVILGPVADIAVEKLLNDSHDKYSTPQSQNTLAEVSKKASGIVRLSAIRDVMDSGKHALLDITPNAVDRLNYAQFYPIVILLRAESKQAIKDSRVAVAKCASKSSRKLLEQSQKLEKMWSHVFSASITVSGSETWYPQLVKIIEKSQSLPVWVSEMKPEAVLSDEFLFPMNILRSSCPSSPESDAEQDSDLGNTSSPTTAQQLVKCTSDPNIVIQGDNPPSSYNSPLSHTPVTSVEPVTSQYPQPWLNGDATSRRMPADLPTGQVSVPKLIRSVTINDHSAHDRLLDRERNEPSYFNATVVHRLNKITSLERRSSAAVVNSKIRTGQNGVDWLQEAQREHSFSSVPNKVCSLNRDLDDSYNCTKLIQQPSRYNNEMPNIPSNQYNGELSSIATNSLVHSQCRKSVAVDTKSNDSIPLAKSASRLYKPIPPPKPKYYRTQIQHNQQVPPQSIYGQRAPFCQLSNAVEYYPEDNHVTRAKPYNISGVNNSNDYTTRSSEDVTSSYSSKYSFENVDVNGFDSGNGSSLDRSGSTYTGSDSSSRACSSTMPIAEPEPNGLDLAHREHRFSAFELYKKPTNDCEKGNYYSHAHTEEKSE